MKFSSIFAGLAFLATVSWPISGKAQTFPKVCDPDDPKSCVQPLTAGEVAPFDGQLLTNRRAAKLAVAAGGCQDRLDLATERERELAAIQVAGEKALRDSDRITAQIQKDLLLKRMADLEDTIKPHWYERPAFVAGVASVVTVALLVVSVRAVQVLE